VLSEYSRVEHRRAPVDFFLRTLADTQGAGAACVILSGTGSDGSSGLRRVKEHGGLTIAQDPGEAEHGEMPARAIGTGFVDYVLPAAQMPGTILSYFNRLRERNEDTPAPTPDPTNSEAVREVLRLVRVRTGHDFSNYKPATVLRRIGRRVTVRAVPGFSEYAALLREQPDEAVALMKELLISVTNFFRDPDAFAALEQRVIPRLFERQSTTDQVRVWSSCWRSMRPTRSLLPPSRCSRPISTSSPLPSRAKGSTPKPTSPICQRHGCAVSFSARPAGIGCAASCASSCSSRITT
jgi:two-component system CheB/CheR fusion protein